MKTNEADKGAAIVCARDGVITRVIRDELGPDSPFKAGDSLVDLVEEACTLEVKGFLNALNERRAAFDWEIPLTIDGVSTPMHFAGAEQEGSLLIMVARSCAGLSEINEELASINNEQTNALRAAIKELSLHARPVSPQDRHLYEDLSRVNNELANLQREMVKKNVELEKLNREKNRFLGMAAHDLRSPLGIILSYSEFLESEASDVLSEEHREFVGTIKDTSKFMLRMVSDLLDVTAIEAGQLKLDLKPVDLESLVRRNVTLNRVLAARKQISVELDPTPNLPLILLDSGKIEQVLNNIISNAVKFSHPNTKVHVRLTLADGFVSLAVQDQGQGIPAADLEKLFKPFSKTSVRSTGGEQSTGLGLAIVRRIVEGHGGRVWVESEFGHGATFHMTLPIHATPQVSN